MINKIIDPIIEFSNNLENEFPDKPAYWHLKKLRSKLNEVKKNVVLDNVVQHREKLLSFVDSLCEDSSVEVIVEHKRFVDEYLERK